MTKKKTLQTIIVLAILAISYGVYFFVATKGISKPEESITASEISQGISPIGKFSDGSITETTSAEAFYELYSLDHIVVTATDIVPTGVYTRKAWVGPYGISNNSSRKNKRKNPIPEETTNPMTNIEFMQQYYLIELEDGSYINAILEVQYADEIKSGESFTLPIGEQRGITQTAKSMLTEITTEYSTEPTPVLYVVDDVWYSANQQDINIKAMLWGIGAFVVLVGISTFAFSKVFED